MEEKKGVFGGDKAVQKVEKSALLENMAIFEEL